MDLLDETLCRDRIKGDKSLLERCHDNVVSQWLDHTKLLTALIKNLFRHQSNNFQIPDAGSSHRNPHVR